MNENLSGTHFEDLAERIQRLKAETTPTTAPDSGEPMNGLGMAFGVAAHMVAGLGVGAAIGYFLDSWLGSSPWMLGLFFFLGAGAGVLNTYRMAMGMDMAMGYRRSDGDKTSERPTAGKRRTGA